jgi:hypothetical protein
MPHSSRTPAEITVTIRTFSEILQGHFKLRSRPPLERLLIQYADKVYYWVERAVYSRLLPTARLAAFMGKACSPAAGRTEALYFSHDRIYRGEELISKNVFSEVPLLGQACLQ